MFGNSLGQYFFFLESIKQTFVHSQTIDVCCKSIILFSLIHSVGTCVSKQRRAWECNALWSHSARLQNSLSNTVHILTAEATNVCLLKFTALMLKLTYQAASVY